MTDKLQIKLRNWCHWIVIKPHQFVLGATFTNPVIDYNTPDPGVLAIPDGSGYLLVSTSNYAERGVGNTLQNFSFGGNKLYFDLCGY